MAMNEIEVLEGR